MIMFHGNMIAPQSVRGIHGWPRGREFSAVKRNIPIGSCPRTCLTWPHS